jgi:hypothetical protein
METLDVWFWNPVKKQGIRLKHESGVGEPVHDLGHEGYPQGRFAPIEHELNILVMTQETRKVIEGVLWFRVGSKVLSSVTICTVEVASPCENQVIVQCTEASR